MSVRILTGDCRDVLRTLPAESVHCVVTSPPYYGLRDYEVTGQIGLELTPAEYLDALVAVFREVRRVLRGDGTAWVNMGDSYANDGKWGGATGGKHADYLHGGETRIGREKRRTGLKPKDLMGIPWALAFALRDDGWYLRQDIIWSKPNPMPESIRDRCTKAHEYLFLLSKSKLYFYDAEAIKEAAVAENEHDLTGPGMFAPGQTPQQGNRSRKIKMPDGWDTAAGGHGSFHREGRERGRTREVPPRHASYANSDRSSLNDVGRGMLRNKRSVWEIPTAPFPQAHFATFPPALIEPCILAGCPDMCCPCCGAPWRAIIERVDQGWDGSKYGERAVAASGGAITGGTAKSTLGSGNGKLVGQYAVSGREPICRCPEHQPNPGICLDPFGGAGTTGLVADRLGRDAILIELNPDYAAMAESRIKGDAPLFAQVGA